MNDKFDELTKNLSRTGRMCDAAPVRHSPTKGRTANLITELACALAVSLASAHASTFADAESQAASGLTVVVSSTSRSNALVDLHATTNYAISYSYGSFSANAAGWGQAQAGMLRVHADGAVRTDSTGRLIGCTAIGRGLASWDDYFTLNADPAHFGKLGSMTVTLDISGGLDVDGYAGSSASFQTFSQFTDSYGSNNVVQGGTRLYVDTSGAKQIQALGGALIGPGLWQRTVYFHFGRPMYVKVLGEAYAYADAAAYAPGQLHMDAQAVSDFGHTIVWGGISDVRDAGGALLTVTNVSDSGYNYLLGNPPTITRVSAVPQGLYVEWTPGPRSYTVETTGSMMGGAWVPVPGVSWPIQSNHVLLPTPTQSPAFFRIKVQ